MTGTRAQSGDTRKFSVCTGTQNDQMAGTSSRQRVTEERGGFETVLTLAVREDLGGFQDFALERLVNEDFGGINLIKLRQVMY